MEEIRALEIVRGAIKDRKDWGANASLRVSPDDLMTALTALAWRFAEDVVKREELTLANRRYAALNAQHERLKQRNSKDGN